MAGSSLFLLLVSLCVIVGIAAGQQCRDGWRYHAGSCYGFGESQVAWGDAQELCIAFNAKLAEVETEEENTYLKDFVRSKQATSSAEMTWIGGTDIFDEGVWEWVSTGQEMSFHDWAPNQPDEAGAEDCLVMYNIVGYSWNDYYCENSANFLCEAEPTDVVVG